jgi:cyclohexyl-isocyanide hydratase
MTAQDQHLQIGSLLFEGLDQIDLTGPFEVLSRLPNATYRIYGTSVGPVRDVKGLRLTPDAVLSDAPQLDVLHIPGGPGQEALMEDEAVLSWVRRQAAGAKIVFSVCTGALICGAAGLLQGRRATTYWGRRCICCPISARSQWRSGWWWTAIWSAPRASPRASTGR